jgi:hypothetical protein
VGSSFTKELLYLNSVITDRAFGFSRDPRRQHAWLPRPQDATLSYPEGGSALTSDLNKLENFI